MYIKIKDKLSSLINKNIILEIDEGRSKKRKEKGKIKSVYDRIFIVEVNGVNMSYSYSDLICKTIVLKTI